MKHYSNRFLKFREKRRLELIRAASKVLNKNGIHRLKVKDVADQMGIGRGTLYEYIKTKHDILFMVMEDALMRSIQELKEQTRQVSDPLLRLKKALHVHLNLIRQNPKILWALYQESTPLSKTQFKKIFHFLDEYNGIFKEILDEGKRDGTFDFEDSYLLAHSLPTMLNTWVIKQNFLDYQFVLEDYERKLTGVILKGVLNLDDGNRERNLERLQSVFGKVHTKKKAVVQHS